MNKLFLVAGAIIPAFLAGCTQPPPLTPWQKQMAREIEAAPPRSLISFNKSLDLGIVCGNFSDGQIRIAMDPTISPSHGCNAPASDTTADRFVRRNSVQSVTPPGSPNYAGVMERLIMARYDVPNK